MCCRFDKMFVGSYVSLADVLQAHVASGGKALQAPGQAKDGDITNVVPLFDDERIHQFLRKHAPSLLEYTASIGMRRIIACIPMTHGYSICAGLWKLVQDLDVDKKTEVHMDMFTKLCATYKAAVGKYFDHLMPLITGEIDAKHCAKAASAGKPRPSYYIAHNGVTNMIRPLMELAQQLASGTNADGDKLVAPILRALVTFETWQMVRKHYKGQEAADKIITTMLHELLGLTEATLQSKKQPLKPLFEAEPALDTIAFADAYTINADNMNKYKKECWFVDYVTQLFPMLFAAQSTRSKDVDSKAIWAGIGKMSDATIKEALKLDDAYPLEQFRFFNVAQALLSTTKADRVNDGGAGAEAAKAVDVSAPSWSFQQAREQEASVEHGYSRIIDLGDAKAADEMVRAYVRGEFKALYESELKVKRAQENDALVKELVHQVLVAPTRQAVLSLFRDGLKRGDTHVRLFNTSSDAFEPLREALLSAPKGKDGDGENQFPHEVRAYALELLLLGRDTDAAAGVDGKHPIVWNNGNVLLGADMKSFAAAFHRANAYGRFDTIKTDYAQRNQHVYRAGKPNRHGHSNDKPSFWALSGGRWQCLADMYKEVTPAEYAAYLAVHRGCCGNHQ
jgi:hypothetical protein